MTEGFHCGHGTTCPTETIIKASVKCRRIISAPTVYRQVCGGLRDVGDAIPYDVYRQRCKASHTCRGGVTK